MIESSVTVCLKKAIGKFCPDFDGNISLEKPKQADHGDYATNVCFLLAKQLKKSPKIIAEEFARSTQAESLSAIGAISALNGFINLKLSDSFLWNEAVKLATQPIQYSINPSYINVEYVSANPTGPLHIGHGRWAILGSALVNILREVGHKVDAEFYINDAGVQIQKFLASVDAVKAGKDVPEDGYHGHYIAELADTEDPVAEMLESHRKTLALVGVEFDYWYSERQLHESGKVEARTAQLKSQGLLYENEGAQWLKTEAYGDDKDRVLVKSDGNRTYFCVDIAYHLEKAARGYDCLVNIWGADHHGYVNRMSAAMQAILGEGFKVGDQFQVIIGQLVTLYSGGEPVRMSKRTGEMVTFNEVIEEIGRDAVRYFLVQQSADSPIDFDLDLAKEKSSENPVYYIQYAHARICSVLEKVSEDEIAIGTEHYGLNEEERLLLLQMVRFPKEMERAATLFSPHIVANYLWKLAKSFHYFYHHCSILNAEGSEKAKRLKLITLCQSTLKMGLNVLGISAPSSM